MTPGVNTLRCHVKMKIWHLGCAVLILYNIAILINERGEINYAMVENTDKNESFNHLFCFPLNQIYNSSTTQIGLDQLYYDLLDFFKSFRSEGASNPIFRIITSRFYFIFKNQLCLQMTI